MLNLRYKLRGVIVALSLLMAVATLSDSAKADPCGMVPPIYTGPGSPITRTGLQRTYVFHKDGVESFVIRPGFQGNVDNFGMLIPFPSPPELRKVSDNVFEQIAAAVDPPEVVVDLRWRARRGMAFNAPMAATAMEVSDAQKSAEVRVLKEEAVGMYEVAVLAAGSAESLKKWMDKNGYQYPKGMDAVANDYIKVGWCFVAVKTKVGKKSEAEPRPGRRRAKPQLPQGGSFDGNVQGMGFRFKSEELVVPMRLSAFNDGELRNIVYLLTDGPRKIRSIPEEYVVRQLSGQQVFKNVTQPLPLRIIGGSEKDIPEYRRKQLPKQRDPVPHNGVAKDLFASDLLAVSSGELSLEHEELEKELLRIGEALGLRGPEADAENSSALKSLRDQATNSGLEMLKQMTLTVVDGDFPREVIANQNLTFAEYKMPNNRNNTLNYDSMKFGPGQAKEGILKVGAVNWEKVELQIAADHRNVRVATGSVLGLSIIVLLGLAYKNRPAALALFIAMLVGLSATATMADYGSQGDDTLLNQLSDSSTAKTAMAALVKKANSGDAEFETVSRALLDVAKNSDELAQRGWAIATLAELGGLGIDEALLDIQADDNQEKLVRTWAAAARVAMSRSTNALVEKANLVTQFPALGRPIGIRLVEKLSEDGKNANVEKVLEVASNVPQLQASMVNAILAFGPEKLTSVMSDAADNKVRRLAAGYLGAMSGQGKSLEVAKSVYTNLAFSAQASEVPWKGGALFLPSIQWGKEDARMLVGQLVRWHLWCDINQKSEEQTQIHNNIRSLGLARAAGYKSPGWRDSNTNSWLVAWGTAVGKAEIEDILKEQNAMERYGVVLQNLQ